MSTKDKTSYQLAVEAVKADNEKTRTLRIQMLFRKLGGRSMHAMVDPCLQSGIFSQSDLEAAARPGLMKIIREALGVLDDSGMPFAGPTTERDDDNQLVWKQRELWEVDDYQANIDKRIADRDANHIVAVRLAAECERRHSAKIKIPSLPARNLFI